MRYPLWPRAVLNEDDFEILARVRKVLVAFSGGRLGGCGGRVAWLYAFGGSP